MRIILLQLFHISQEMAIAVLGPDQGLIIGIIAIDHQDLGRLLSPKMLQGTLAARVFLKG